MRNYPGGAHPPQGQPYANPRVIHRVDKAGKKIPNFKFPHQVLSVKSKGELLAALRHYSHPMPMVEGAVSVKSKAGLRYMVEWVFPALRWYCKVYGVEVPKWLVGNGWAEGMDKEDFTKFLGEKPLLVREFTEDKLHAGSRS